MKRLSYIQDARCLKVKLTQKLRREVWLHDQNRQTATSLRLSTFGTLQRPITGQAKCWDAPARRAAPRHINCTALPFIGVCCKLLFTVRNVGSTDNRIPHPGQSPSASGNFVPPSKFSLLSISGGGGGVRMRRISLCQISEQGGGFGSASPNKPV